MRQLSLLGASRLLIINSKSKTWRLQTNFSFATRRRPNIISTGTVQAPLLRLWKKFKSLGRKQYDPVFCIFSDVCSLHLCVSQFGADCVNSAAWRQYFCKRWFLISPVTCVTHYVTPRPSWALQVFFSRWLRIRRFKTASCLITTMVWPRPVPAGLWNTTSTTSAPFLPSVMGLLTWWL